MVMDERTKVSQHHHRHHQQRGEDDVGVRAGDLGLHEDLTNVEGTSSAEGSPPPSTNGTMVGDGPTDGPPVNVYLIGLEFVRQYYTVLHQGPLYLHRFYSEDSSFVHDDSKAVYGQVNIRERIQQLNFCNCVAKILQVDSHDTLGNGVVIQVRGELSNNGQPMRRFMQTIVLAPQSPKRFYVRNDIFHYQDEIVPKDEYKSLGPSSMDSVGTHDDADDEKSDDDYGKMNNMPSMPPSAGNRGSVGVNNLEGLHDEQKPIESMRVEVLDRHINEDHAQPQLQSTGRRGSHGFVVAPPPELAVEEPKEAVQAGPPPPPVLAAPKQQAPAAVTPTPAPVTPTGTPDIPPAGPVPKTYANLFKSGPNPVATSVPLQQTRTNPPFPVKTVAPSGLSPASENEDVTSPPMSSPQPPNDQSSASVVKNLPPVRGQFGAGAGYNRDRNFRERRNENRERLTSRSSTTGNDDAGSVDGDGRRSNISYPDSHQLFVGNLPHTVTPAEMKEIFGPYGKVAEVKILKPNQKNAGSKVPYFCFVVFEEAASAEAALVEKTKITMKMSDGSNRRLNVEEKRPRDVMEGRNFPPGGGNNMPPNFSRDSRENLNAPAGGLGAGNNNTGGGNTGNPNQFRRGDNNGGNMNRPMNPGGGPPGEHRSQPPRTRTFRGSNRGGGAVGGGGGGGPPGAR